MFLKKAEALARGLQSISTAETMDLNRSTRIGLLITDQSSFYLHTYQQEGSWPRARNISVEVKASRIQNMEQRLPTPIYLRTQQKLRCQ